MAARPVVSTLFLLLVALLGVLQASASREGKVQQHLRALRAHKVAKAAEPEAVAAAEEEEGDDDDDDDDVPVDVAPASGPVTPQDEKIALQSAVHDAHEELAENLRQQVEVNGQIAELDDVEKSHQMIDASVEAVKNETQSPAMANFLGDMWKEMRMFAKPFYKEHLEEKLASLESKTPSLSANFTKAQAALTAWDPKAVDTLQPEVETVPTSELQTAAASGGLP